MTASRLSAHAIVVASFAVAALFGCDPEPPPAPTTADHRIILRDRTFTPPPTTAPFLASGRTHGVLQFFDRPCNSLAHLARLGVTVHGFLRHNAYFVTVPADISASDLRDIGVRALLALQPADKLSPSARHLRPGVRETVTISYAGDMSRAQVARALDELGAAVIQFASPNLVVVDASSAQVQALAQRGWVWWIEPATSELGSLLDNANAAIRADEVQAPPWGTGIPGLTGSGVSVAMWEVGGAPLSTHPDFGATGGGSRVSNGEPVVDVTGHATQVAGTLVGNGAASESEGGIARQWAGVAPEAMLFAHDVMAGDVIGDEIATSFASNDTLITNHSWGFTVDGPEDCAGVGTYGTHSQVLDDVANTLPITSVLAAGNEATIVPNEAECEISVLVEGGLVPVDPAFVAEGYGTVNGRATSKNTIAVGSRAKNLDVTLSSSRGPTRDGRVKPDLVAIGGTSNVPLMMPGMVSTYSQSYGTSFSTPQVTGAAALLVQHYRQLANDPDLAPDPALLKAVLMNTAQTLGAEGPSYSRGYGIVNIEAAVGAAQDYETVLLLDGQMQTVVIPAGPADACELRVMAVWTDPAAMMPAAETLVHDVDLTVAVPQGILQPWTLDPQMPINPALRAENHVDNVEQVTVALPTGAAQAMLVGDLPMAPEQEVVVHWHYAPCGDGADGATDGADGDGGGAGCSGCSTSPSPFSAAATLFILLAARRRER